MEKKNPSFRSDFMVKWPVPIPILRTMVSSCAGMKLCELWSTIISFYISDIITESVKSNIRAGGSCHRRAECWSSMWLVPERQAQGGAESWICCSTMGWPCYLTQLSFQLFHCREKKEKRKVRGSSLLNRTNRSTYLIHVNWSCHFYEKTHVLGLINKFDENITWTFSSNIIMYKVESSLSTKRKKEKEKMYVE